MTPMVSVLRVVRRDSLETSVNYNAVVTVLEGVTHTQDDVMEPVKSANSRNSVTKRATKVVQTDV